VRPFQPHVFNPTKRMTHSKLAFLATLAGLSITSGSALAQQRSSATQAQQMLQNNPALLQQLRQRIMTSGLTPDQVRARLRAEGYPENLLDAYLPGSTGAPDSSAKPEDVFSAITQLGIADTTEVDLLRCGINTDTLAVPDTQAATLPTKPAGRSQLWITRTDAGIALTTSLNHRLMALMSPSSLLP